MKIINKATSKKIKTSEDTFIKLKDGGDIDLELLLNKEGSTANIWGIILGSGDQIYNIKTTSLHTHPNTNSRVHIKAVMLDNSVLNYEGMIKISKHAQLTDAFLKNDNLIIGSNAKVNSSPQLEIEADDVKASHGVTISNVNEEEKFYLKSRGISDKKAQKILIDGFINDILIHASK